VGSLEVPKEGRDDAGPEIDGDERVHAANRCEERSPVEVVHRNREDAVVGRIREIEHAAFRCRKHRIVEARDRLVGRRIFFNAMFLSPSGVQVALACKVGMT